MSELISLNQLLLLSGIHLLIGAILYTCGHFFLPKSFRLPLLSFLIVIQLWSLMAVIMLYIQEDSFIGWLFNPSGEKNSAALLSTTLLMLTACSGLSLLWMTAQKRNYTMTGYWLLLTGLYFFLAIDEYFSIHETIVFWRGGYLILGATVALISFVVMMRGDSKTRLIMLMFIIGLGIMGFAGVVLDAFSAESLLDIGPIKLTFIRCNGYFIGLNCREFGNTEEMMELSGAAIAWLSLTALTYQTGAKKSLILRNRFVYGISIGWLLSLILWMWVVPEIQAHFATPANTTYGNLSLLAYDLNTRQIQPGDKVTLTVYAQADRPMLTSYSMSVHLYSRSNPVESIVQDDMELGEFAYPGRAWLPRIAVRNRFQLNIPDDLPLNQSYQLIAIVWEDSVHNRIPIQETIFPIYNDGTTLVLDTIAAPAEDTLSSTRSRVFQFDEGFSLTDFSLPDNVAPGETVNVDFLWEVDETQEISATHFMHWFNIETGDYIIFDQIPFEGLFPTQDWVAGMRVRDSWAVTLPDDIAPGTYRVQTGMFETQSAERLSVSDSSGLPIQDNSIVPGEITVGE